MFSSSSSSYDDAQAFDPSSYMSLTECLQIGALDFNSLATSFGLPDQQGNNNNNQKPSSEDIIVDCEGGFGTGIETETPVLTSLSCSSSEPGAEEEELGKNTTVVDGDNQEKQEEDAERSKKG